MVQTFLHYYWAHVSMLTLAFRSKHGGWVHYSLTELLAADSTVVTDAASKQTNTVDVEEWTPNSHIMETF